MNAYLDLLRARNDNKVIALRKDPCQRHLTCSGIVFLADGSNFVNDIQDLRKVLFLIPVIDENDKRTIRIATHLGIDLLKSPSSKSSGDF